MQYRIVVDDKIPFIRGVLENYARVDYITGHAIDKAAVKNADIIIIRTRTLCNRDLLQGTKVKLILSATIGYDHIDTVYCMSKGIAWRNAPGCNSGSVMQYIASSLLHYACSRHIDLKKRVLGIVGVGNVGQKVLHLADALDMQVLLNDPPREQAEGGCGFISLKGLLREADIISFHVPLVKDGEFNTRHMMNADFLKQIRKGSLLMNTSRGEVIDQEILKKGMDDEIIKDVILDVWEDEPNLDYELMQQSYLATPHIAGYSADGKANATRVVVQEAARFMHIDREGWKPELPKPATERLFCNARSKSFQEVLFELVRATYPIDEDDRRFREYPGKFEELRGMYPLRREFPAYTVVSENMPDKYRIKLMRLGFRFQKPE